MRFMMIVKHPESGKMPDPKLIEAIKALNEKQTKAGVLLDAGGLHPSAKGARIHVSNGKLKVVDGPFTETKELVGGYAVMVADSREEAVRMGRAFMQLHVDILGDSYEGELEIRLMHEPSDFDGGGQG